MTSCNQVISSERSISSKKETNSIKTTGLRSLDPLVYYHTPIQKFIRADENEDWRELEVDPTLEINQWGQIRYANDHDHYLTPNSPRIPRAYRIEGGYNAFMDISLLVYTTFKGELPGGYALRMVDNNPFNYHYDNIIAIPFDYVEYAYNNPRINPLAIRALRRFKNGKPVWEMDSWIKPPIAFHASTTHAAHLMGIRVEQVSMYLAGIYSKTIHDKKLITAFEEDEFLKWMRWHLLPAQLPIIDTQGLGRFIGVEPTLLRKTFQREEKGKPRTREQRQLNLDVREALETGAEVIEDFLANPTYEKYNETADFDLFHLRKYNESDFSYELKHGLREPLEEYVEHVRVTKEARGWYFDPEYQNDTVFIRQQEIATPRKR